MNALITVIIPVFNSEKYLERCLESVLNNTYKNLEVILVDDGSQDLSGCICDSFAASDSRVKVIHKKNEGTAEARNTALRIANGDYIAFLDNDDFIHPCFYEYMIKALKDTEADIVVCELTRDMPVDVFYTVTYTEPLAVNKHDFILGTYTGDWTRNTTPWNKLYKRSLFSETKFPYGKGYEDAYTTYKLLYKAEKIAYLNSVLYYWYENKESYSGNKNNAQKLLFREEALCLQSKYYTDAEYQDVSRAAKEFYYHQLYSMLWQLDHDYIQNSTTKSVRLRFLRKLKREYRMYKNICKDSKEIYEYLFPKKAAIKHKFSHFL